MEYDDDVPAAPTVAYTPPQAQIVLLLQVGKKAGILWPKIKMPFMGGTLEFTLSQKYPDSANIKLDGNWLGALKQDRRIFWNLKVSIKQEIRAGLHKITEDQDLVSTLAATGRRVGWCCFCSRRLDNHVSVQAGYGPICAEKFGLPWEADTKLPVISPEDI